MNYKKIPNKYNLIHRAMENDGYRDFRYTNQHGLICMGKLIEGWSIFTDIDNNGYKNRFCYHTERGASANFIE